MFKIKCRCGTGEQSFKFDIGPFYIDECCTAAGYDELGNKVADRPPILPSGNTDPKVETINPVELTLDQAETLTIDDPEKDSLDVEDIELPNESTDPKDEPCFATGEQTKEFLEEELAISKNPDLIPDPVFTEPTVETNQTVTSLKIGTEPISTIKVKRTYTKKTKVIE